MFPLRTDFPAGPIWVRGAEIERSGRLFSGFVCANTADSDELTAFFSAYEGGYQISPEPDSRGKTKGAATKHVRDFATVLDLAQQWEA